jgi:hypothetical protein
MTRAAYACLVALALAAPAAAEPTFVTLERADRGTRFGIQSSFQLYPHFSDNYGLRFELYFHHAPGAWGAYGHFAVGHIFGQGDSVTALANLEGGGYYVARLDAATDLVFHFGASLPTASEADDAFTTNVLTHVERNYDLVDALPDDGVVNLGLTLRRPLGARGFVQADLAMDVGLGGAHAPIVHLNLGAGVWLGSVALLAEAAALTVEGHQLASLALGARFRAAANPHVAYVMAIGDDEITVDDDGGVIAHVFSAGVQF